MLERIFVEQNKTNDNGVPTYKAYLIKRDKEQLWHALRQPDVFSKYQPLKGWITPKLVQLGYTNTKQTPIHNPYLITDALVFKQQESVSMMNVMNKMKDLSVSSKQTTLLNGGFEEVIRNKKTKRNT